MIILNIVLEMVMKKGNIFFICGQKVGKLIFKLDKMIFEFEFGESIILQPTYFYSSSCGSLWVLKIIGIPQNIKIIKFYWGKKEMLQYCQGFAVNSGVNCAPV